VPVFFQQHCFLVVVNLERGCFEYMDSLEDARYYDHACKVTANLRKYPDNAGFGTREWDLIGRPVTKQKNG
jgi:Ulp1 family protease